MRIPRYIIITSAMSFALLSVVCVLYAQTNEPVKVVRAPGKNKINIYIGGTLFTSFLYPDTLEKPVLYPVYTATGIPATRGFPLDPKAGDPTDHPHHIGIWFNFENVNGLDFWNNSYAIPADKKHLYGWVKTDRILQASGGKQGILTYHANWVNQKNHVLLQEVTRFTFSGTVSQRIIDRQTTLTADTAVVFTDAKDGLLGIRLAHALQMPTTSDQTFADDKGIVTVVKGGTDTIASGNYVSSEAKEGDAVWSSRAKWCKVYGTIANYPVSVIIIDHPANPNYPTYWHARGYGLFAANPLGEKIFTDGKAFTNLTLKKGGSVTFRYRIIIDDGKDPLSAARLNELADDFARVKN